MEKSAEQASARSKAKPGPVEIPTGSDASLVLALQRACGNRAVQELRRSPAYQAPGAHQEAMLSRQVPGGNRALEALLGSRGAASPVGVQRTVWIRNIFTDSVDAIAAGPGNFPLTQEIRSSMAPGDRYDEATGELSRSSRNPAFTPGRGGAASTPLLGEAERPPGHHRMSDRISKARSEGMTTRSRARRAERAAETRKGDQQSLTTAYRSGLLRTYPTHPFEVDGERHRLFVGLTDGVPELMIASLPLPVAAFLLELKARQVYLVNKVNSAKMIKKPRAVARSDANITALHSAATVQLSAANAVFVDVTKTDRDRLTAEEQLASALSPLIKAISALAARIGAWVTVGGNYSRKNPNKGLHPSDVYTKRMAEAEERYKIEGLVARYSHQPDYPSSGFERDHQPHNDLIETVAALPAFAGKKIQNIAAGRTQLGWSLMLHHQRHSRGRTYGNLGGQVTAKFTNDLASHTAANAANQTDAAIRQFSIDYLVQSLRDDAAAMISVANNPASYPDILNSAVKNKVKQQILDGEARMLQTEAEVRTFGS